ncbi:MAG: hypothetical protein AAB801_02930 [Patescibacteria group bacterium]
MKLKKYLIANGNSTLLIWGCPVTRRKELVAKYLARYEQVGFVTISELRIPTLSMMGNELCINATLALASSLGQTGQLYTSGLDTPIRYTNSQKQTSIKFQMETLRTGKIVILSGIGYVLLRDSSRVSKSLLRGFSEKFNLPAFGAIITDGYKMTPVVYVKDTDSMIYETACGSGSIALNVLINAEKILQPSGEEIKVKRKQNTFTVKAKVVKIDRSIR